MAFVDNSATFSGKYAQDFYSTALLGATTISNIEVIPNIKNTFNLASLDVTGLLQSDDCSYSSVGTTTLATRALTVCGVKVNYTFCVKDLEAGYLAEQLRPGASSNTLPATFQDYIVGQMGKYIASEVEQIVWQGDTTASPASVCDGFIKAMQADGNVIDQAATPLSASNIVAEITKVYNLIPNTIKTSGKVRIFVSPAAASFYKLACANVATGNGAYYIGDRPLDFLGIPLVVANGLSANQMVACETTNLVFGTDLLDDTQTINLIDMALTTGEPNIRFVGHFKMGVQYRVGSEIVLYS